jgi:acylphosphatase
VIARHFVVDGVVQGVAFRWATKRTADRLGIAGWVRNKRDGTVEGWAETDADLMAVFETWLGEGPMGARVSRVIMEEAVPACLAGFEIRY